MANETTCAGADFFTGLMEEHARIEVRLRALDQAALRLGRGEVDAAALAVIAETLRFFATEGARHQAHEELTLFPRLQPLAQFKQILSAMAFQHRMNDDTGRELAASVERSAPGRELGRLAARFAEMHRCHLLSEERALFPLASSLLAPEVQAEMGREMRERVGDATPA